MERKRWDAVELAQELVRIESTNPGRFEGEVSRFVRRHLEEAGICCDVAEVMPKRCNVRAVLPGRWSIRLLFLFVIWIRLWRVRAGRTRLFRGRYGTGSSGAGAAVK